MPVKAADEDTLREIYTLIPENSLQSVSVEDVAVPLLKGINSVDKKLTAGRIRSLKTRKTAGSRSPRKAAAAYLKKMENCGIGMGLPGRKRLMEIIFCRPFSRTVFWSESSHYRKSAADFTMVRFKDGLKAWDLEDRRKFL